MRRIFICSTPYQIMNALNVAFHDEQTENDLMIVESFDLSRLSMQAMETCFNNVYFSRRVHYSSFKLKRYVQRTKYLLCPQKYLEDHLRKSSKSGNETFQHYDEICYSYLLSECEALIAMNREADIIRMEDGIGSYFGDIYAQSFGWKYFLFAKVFRVGYAISKPRKIVLNNIDLYHNKDRGIACQAPEFDKDFVEYANTVFGGGSPDYHRLIWLTQPLNIFIEKPELLSHLSNFLASWRDDMSVKVHPREAIDDNYNMYDVVEDKSIWELTIHNIDVENKILLGVYSSAQFTPKILFDKEPYVILLYRLFPKVLENQEEMEEFIRFFKQSYRNKNKVIIPESWQSLQQVLANLINV